MHYLPPTPSGFLQWFRRLHRTLLPASGELGRTCFVRVVNFGHLLPGTACACRRLSDLPVRIVTHSFDTFCSQPHALAKILVGQRLPSRHDVGSLEILQSG